MGKPRFFSEKPFYFLPSFVIALSKGKIREISPSDITIARRNVQIAMTRVQIPSRATAVMKLHRFHIFTDLQRLIIAPRDLYKTDDIFGFEEGDFATPAPPRLVQILSGFGMRVDDLHVDVMLHHYDLSTTKDENIQKFLSIPPEQQMPYLIEEFYKPMQSLVDRSLKSRTQNLAATRSIRSIGSGVLL